MLLTTALVLTVSGALPASATFTSLSPGGAPSARRSMGMAEQQVGPNAANLWIFGGFAGLGARSELYRFDTATGNWLQVSGSGAPSARERHGLGFDPVHQRLIVFGGSVQSGFQFNATNELYVFDPAGNAWALYAAQGTPPSARIDPAVVWAPSIGKFLIFGGNGSPTGNTRTNDLWTLELDTANSRGIWTLLAPSGTAPSARNAVCAAFDSAGNRMVLFGGEGNGASAVGGTFQYDVASNAWQTDAPTGTVPSPRSFAQCGFDPVSRSLILYGGYDGNAVLGGTFAYDPVAKVWASYAPTLSPGTLSDAGAAYSSVLGGILLFGGQSAVGTYINSTWKLVMTPAGTNQPPLANAGPNQSVNEQVLVSLSGAGSSDPEGQSLSYTWTQTAGPSVTLSSNTAQQPTFTSPTVLQPRTLTFSLVVNDGTQNSTPDTVDVVVQDNVNEPPLASAGPDQNVNPRVTVTLSGTSSDPNNDLMTVAWTQTAGPAVTLTGATTASPSFTSPATATGTSLTFQFTVTDSRGGTATDTVVVNVAADAPPSANAGPNQSVNEQVTVTLDGSASADPLNQPLTYSWTQTAGPAVALSSATAPQPTFTSPTVLQPTTLTFRLVVSDGTQSSAPATVDVLVQDNVNEPPVANAGPDQSVAGGVQVTLTAAASSDPNNDAFSFAWSQLTGTSVTLTGVNTPAPSFTSPISATSQQLTFRVTVTDSRGGSATDDVVITVQANLPPVANAGPNQSVNEQALVTLTGASSNDPEAQPLTFAWTQTAGPAVTLSSTTAPQPTFTSPGVLQPTTLTFRLVVNDGVQASAPDTIDVVVQDNLNELPTANAGADQNVNPNVAVTLSGAGTDPNNEALSYAWTRTAGPAVTLTGGNTATASFTSPRALTGSALTFQLTVTDVRGGSANDQVVINVAADAPPVANAGPDQSVAEQAAVALNGSGSSDPLNQPLTYAWTQTAGPTVTLSGGNTAAPSFTAPSLTMPATLTFQLQVSDGLSSSTDSVIVSVQDSINEPPVADAGADQSVGEQTQVTLSGAGSSDPEAQPIAFAWTQLAGPAVSLSSSTSQQPTFTTPSVTQPTTLTFQLVVNDGAQNSAPDTVDVLVQDDVNEPPVANAGADQTVAASVTVVLDGAASSDPNAETLTFAWTQLQGTPVTLAPNGATTSFTSPATDETLTFRLTVTDARGASAADDVSVVVTTNVNGPPNAVALVTPVSGNAPLSVALDGTSSSAALTRTLQSWRWDLGDGTPPLLGATAAHIYVLPGGYNLSLTVTDDAGASDIARVQVSAGDNGLLPPLARIVATPESGAAPLQVALGCACSDPQGRPLSYFWELGDGTTSVSATVAHGFDVAGTYPVRLFVSNGALTTTDLVLIEISGAQGTPPRARLFAQPAFGPAPLSSSFVVEASDADGSITSQVITFHDGTTSSVSDTSFTYAAPGRYRVGLVVTDDTGLTAADSVEVVVTGSDGRAPPKIISTGALTGRVGEPYLYDEDLRAEAIGSGAIVWELGEPVPPNATIDSATGEVRWTPDRAGTARLVIRARIEGVEATDAQVLDVEVEPIDPYSLVVGCGCGASSTSWPLAWIVFASLLLVARRRRG